MPYRRLPNTDSARLKALNTALKRGENLAPRDKPYSQSSLQNIQQTLPKFEMLIKHQKEAYKAQTDKSPDYIYLHKKAKNYVSHFIQVLNLAIIRGDLKKDARSFFGLDADVKKLPVFKTEQDLIKWGEIVLKGENERIAKGGNPMTNPTIGIVRVHFEKFVAAHRHQKTLQENYSRSTKAVAEYRSDVDRVILQLWNEIEAAYHPNDEVKRRNVCREFGLVYFFRRNEIIPENENVSNEYRKNRVVNKDLKEKALSDSFVEENLVADEAVKDVLEQSLEAQDITEEKHLEVQVDELESEPNSSEDDLTSDTNTDANTEADTEIDKDSGDEEATIQYSLF